MYITYSVGNVLVMC